MGRLGFRYASRPAFSPRAVPVAGLYSAASLAGQRRRLEVASRQAVDGRGSVRRGRACLSPTGGGVARQLGPAPEPGHGPPPVRPGPGGDPPIRRGVAAPTGFVSRGVVPGSRQPAARPERRGRGPAPEGGPSPARQPRRELHARRGSGWTRAVRRRGAALAPSHRDGARGSGGVVQSGQGIRGAGREQL